MSTNNDDPLGIMAGLRAIQATGAARTLVVQDDTLKLTLPKGCPVLRFDTSEFYLSHRREPRGRGSWAFDFNDGKGVWFARYVGMLRGQECNVTSMIYSDACKAARIEAKRRKLPSNTYVFVGS